MENFTRCVRDHPTELAHEVRQLMILFEEVEEEGAVIENPRNFDDAYTSKSSYCNWIRDLYCYAGAGAGEGVPSAAMFLFLNRDIYSTEELDILDMHLSY